VCKREAVRADESVSVRERVGVVVVERVRVRVRERLSWSVSERVRVGVRASVSAW
jgi:hypothetical protein